MAVLNKNVSGIPAGAVYIGRGSKWGNDWSHLKNTKAKYIVATRDEACECYRRDLLARVKDGRVTLEELAELDGKDLVCFCAPARCHGHTLEKAAAWATSILQSKKNLIGPEDSIR